MIMDFLINILLTIKIDFISIIIFNKNAYKDKTNILPLIYINSNY